MANSILAEAARLNSLGGAAFCGPYEAKYQIRVELSSRGFSACTLQNRGVSNLYFASCVSFEESVTRLAAWLKKINPRPGTALILACSSDQIGSDKQLLNSPGFKKLGFDSPAQVDFTARKDPPALGLRDPNLFGYRALFATSPSSNPHGRLDLLKLELGSTSHFATDFKGLAVHRCFAPLSWLQFLRELEPDAFTGQTLVVFADPGKTYFIGTRQGEVVGIRILDRSRGLNIKEVQNSAQDFNFDPRTDKRGFQLMLVELTANRTAMAEVANQADFLEHDKRMHASGDEFCSAIPELRAFIDAPSLPLTLFLKTPGFRPLIFLAASESQRPTLSRPDLLAINALRLLQKVLILLALTLPMATLAYYFNTSLTPEWNVDLSLVQSRSRELAQLQALDSNVRQALHISNSRISVADLIKLVYGTIDPSYVLTKITGQTTPKNLTLFITGTAPQDKTNTLDTVCTALGATVPNLVPGWEAQAQVTRNEIVEGPLKSVPRVNFELKLTLTPHQP